VPAIRHPHASHDASDDAMQAHAERGSGHVGARPRERGRVRRKCGSDKVGREAKDRSATRPLLRITSPRLVYCEIAQKNAAGLDTQGDLLGCGLG
jgi:hypothetical protein